MSDDAWVVCPWCSSDEPTGDPDPTNVNVTVYETESSEERIAFRCHECTKQGEIEVGSDG